MFEWMRGVIESGGYVGLAFLMFLENVFPPIPSELIMPLAGFVASKGRMILVGAIAAGTVGSVLGSLPLYFVGRALGQERLERWADKHGRWLTVSRQDLQKSRAWFERHGHKAVLLGRLVPGVRSLIAIPAGVAKMPLPQFLIYTALGSLAWAAILAGLGYQLAERFENVERILNPISKIIVGAIVLAWLYRVVKGSGTKNAA